MSLDRDTVAEPTRETRGGLGHRLIPWVRRGRMIRDGVMTLTGWRRAALAFGAGAVAVLALAPFFMFPALIVSFTVLVWLLDGMASRPRPVRSSAVTGWWFGFGFFVVGLHWIGHAFLVNAEAFAWMMPLAVMILPAGLALFTAAALALAARIWTPGISRILVLASAWTLLELARGHLFTGFPWNLMGQVWVGHDAIAQAATWLGSYGLSFVAVLTAASPALLLDRPSSSSTTIRLTPVMIPMLAAGFLAALWGAGTLRLAGQSPVLDADAVTVRLVQPGTRQKERLDPANRPLIWARLIAMTADARDKGVTHVVWPEAAAPYLLGREAGLRRQVGEILDPGMSVVTGAFRGEANGTTGRLNIYNSIFVLNSDGDVLSTYDKHHLVPFGEYIPFRPILSALGIGKIVQEIGETSMGDGPRSLTLPGGLRIGPAICYEIIFPGNVTDAGDRPSAIFNLTDDDWFGTGIGPRQHLAIARLRAIEENMPVVRVANSGISAMIDRFGRVQGQIGLQTQDHLDVPLAQAGAMTPFIRFGHGPVLALIVISLLIGAIRRGR